MEIPDYLAKVDQYEKSLTAKTLSSAQAESTRHMSWAQAADLDRRLRQWKKDWADTYPKGQAIELSSQGDDPFPIFRCLDWKTMVLKTPKTFVYPDMLLANAMCMYWAVQLVLSVAGAACDFTSRGCCRVTYSINKCDTDISFGEEGLRAKGGKMKLVIGPQRVLPAAAALARRTLFPADIAKIINIYLPGIVWVEISGGGIFRLQR